jgi:nucleoid-associated protein YgaU
MEQIAKATLFVKWDNRPLEPIAVQYNPTELSYDKGAQFAEIAIPGLDAPLQQFVRGQTEKLTLELFFDTTEQGMGADVTSVTTLTDRIYQLVKIEPTRHAPPICTFVWNDQFPGNSLGGATTGAASGNQRRNGFTCIVESVKQKFTLFSPAGVPLRATLTVALREYKTLDEQLAQLNLSSPDRTHSHVVQRGETLSGIAGQLYRRPGEWRLIAEANNIEDPRRLTAGTFLTVPPIR